MALVAIARSSNTSIGLRRFRLGVGIIINERRAAAVMEVAAREGKGSLGTAVAWWV